MATIPIRKHIVKSITNNGKFFPEASGQTFKCGDLVYLSGGYLTACASNAVLCLGVAKQKASGTQGTLIEVEFLTGKTLELNCKAGTDYAVTMIGNAYGIDVLSTRGYEGFVVLDNTDTTNKLFLVLDPNFEDLVGDSTPTQGRVKVVLLHGADQAAQASAGSFTTLAASGNTTVGGTLGVTGAVTLTAGITVGTTLAVTGAATLTGAVLAKAGINLGTTATKNSMTIAALTLTALASGVVIFFVCGVAPDGNCTLDVGGLGAKKLLKGDRSTQVGNGGLSLNGAYMAIYDATLDGAAGAWYIPGLT